jgi:SAM-dependent methyltransferase
MQDREKRLAPDSNEYRLPDHWLLRDESVWRLMHDAYVKRVVQLVVQSGARTVLEVGCGDGWNCAQLVNAGLEVTGVDLSTNAIEHARRMVPQGRFLCGDTRDRDFLGEFAHDFDAVILVEVIEHIPPADCIDAIRNITRYVKPGGAFVLTTPSTNCPNKNPQHYRHFDEKTLRELAKKAGGLIIKAIEGYGDALCNRRYWRLARWVDNRYYLIKPLRRWLQRRYSAACLDAPTSPDRSQGLVLLMQRELLPNGTPSG